MNITLECSVCSNPPASVKWVYENGTLPYSAYVTGSSLTITNIEVDQSGNYTCTRSNSIYGVVHSTSYTYYVKVQEEHVNNPSMHGTPGPAENLTIEGVTSVNVILQWASGGDGGLNDTTYTVYYKEAGLSSTFVVAEEGLPWIEEGHTQRANVSSLANNTNYEFEIIACNTYNDTSCSEAARI